MLLADAVSRIERLRIRRIEKADVYTEVAAEYEARALSVDEVLNASQREFLTSLGMTAQRNAKTMREDAEALTLVLGAVAP